MQFAQNASYDDLEKLLQIAMAEQNLQRRVELIWGLRRATVQIPEEIISKLLTSENEDIRDTAFYILKKNPSPKMRDYALSLIISGEDIVNAISLLSKNILPEDEQLFCDAVKSIPANYSEGDWHSAFMSAEDGMKNLRGKPKTDILEYLYRNQLCGSCREWIVRLMHKKKILPDEILQECRYDSNSDVRDFAERIIKNKQS